MSEHTKTYKQILILKIVFSFLGKLQKLVQSEKCCRCELKTDTGCKKTTGVAGLSISYSLH